MSRELPAKPNLELLRKQAKELLRSWRQHRTAPSNRTRLSDAQHAIAREYGFANWSKLKQHVDAVVGALLPAEALSAAVRASDAAGVARTLRQHPELKAHLNEPMADYGDDGQQPLIAAVQRGDRKTIDVLLGAGAEVNARSRWWAGGIGVLDECAPELAGFLTERGAVADAHAAARLGMLDRLRELVAADPGVVHSRGWNGQMPLHCASTVAIAEFLVEHGAEIDAQDLGHESTPAQHMLRVVQARHYPKDRQEIARYLVAHGCRTDILMAAALGNLALARRHVERNPDCVRVCVCERDFPKQDPRSSGTVYFALFGAGRTPHLVARDFGHEEVFQYLLAHSPDDVKAAQALELGDAEAFRAAMGGRTNLAETLTDAERRRLPDAAQNNNTAAVGLMLEAGWPVDAQGEYHLTALGWAAWHGNAQAVREILRYHPELELESDHKISALGCAIHGAGNSWHRDTGDYAAAVEALLAAGAKAPQMGPEELSDAVLAVLQRYEEGRALLRRFGRL
jgi:ankyrin repeat protein